MTLAGRFRARRITPLQSARAKDYAESIAPAESRRLQLETFNRLWSGQLLKRPYFGGLAEKFSLPEAFSSWEEFAERMPVTTKSDIQQFREEMTGPGSIPDLWKMTGGSTAEPLQLPAWQSEETTLMPNIWLGRSWYGIGPQDRLFMIWGHSHLLGQGLAGRINGILRRGKDRLLGYHRFSAYDLGEASMRRAAGEMLRFRPAYIIAYSVALDTFARVNAGLASRFKELELKAAIGTAERFPFDDSRDFIADILGCPVAMEYGAVETGVMAHTCPGGGFKTFWRHYFLDTAGPGAGETLHVTCLYDRCLPLVRYEIGDMIRSAEAEECPLGIRRLEEVAGRCNDFVALSDGTRVHSEAFSHCVRGIPQISRFQVVERGGDVAIHFVVTQALGEKESSEIRLKLGKIHPLLARIALVETDALEQTVAGKTPMVIRSGESSGTTG